MSALKKEVNLSIFKKIGITDNRSLFILAIALCAGAYFGFVSPAEAKLVELNAQSTDLSTKIADDKLAISNKHRLVLLQNRIVGQLQSLGRGNDSSQMTGQFLKSLQKIAASNNVKIIRIDIDTSAANRRPIPLAPSPNDPAGAPTVTTSTSGSGGALTPAGFPNPLLKVMTVDDAFNATTFKVVVEGRYQGILKTIAQTSRGRTLVGVGNLALTKNTSSKSQNDIDAVMNISIYRLLPDIIASLVREQPLRKIDPMSTSRVNAQGQGLTSSSEMKQSPEPVQAH